MHLHLIQRHSREREELTDAADSINRLEDASWESAFHVEDHENQLSGR
jgi:hypothetical protein